jgi:O-antigen/teichoic acid export membrane protein
MRYPSRGIYRLRAAIAESILHPLAKNVTQLVGSQSISAVVRLGTTVFVVRILTPAEYGTAALLMAYPALVASIVGTKSQTVTIRYLSLFRSQQNRAELRGMCKLAFAADFLFAMLVFICVGVTADWYALWFNVPPGLAWLMIVYAGSFPLASLAGTSLAILNSHQEFRGLALATLLQPLLNLAGVVGLLSLGFGVAGMVVALAIGPAVNAVVMNVVATRVLYLDGSGFWWRGTWKSVKRFRREFYRVLSWNYMREAMGGGIGVSAPHVAWLLPPGGGGGLVPPGGKPRERGATYRGFDDSRRLSAAVGKVSQRRDAGVDKHLEQTYAAGRMPNGLDAAHGGFSPARSSPSRLRIGL